MGVIFPEPDCVKSVNMNVTANNFFSKKWPERALNVMCNVRLMSVESGLNLARALSVLPGLGLWPVQIYNAHIRDVGRHQCLDRCSACIRPQFCFFTEYSVLAN